MSHEAKNELVRSRQLKVQRLVIPFTITASATPSAVTLRTDEPAILALKSEGVDQITTALETSETATYTVTPDDSDGTLNLLVRIREPIGKVQRANVTDRVNGGSQPCKLGSSTGITTGTGGGSSIMLTMDSSVDHSTTNFDGCLEVEYTISE